MRLERLYLLPLLAMLITAIPQRGLDGQERIDGIGWVDVKYTVDALTNVSGGTRRGAHLLDNVGLVFHVDGGDVLGWTGTTVQVHVLGVHGNSPSTLVGDAQGVSNIDAPDSWRLFEAWVEQRWRGGLVSLKTGIYDLNSEFDAIEVAGLFLNSSHGIGPDLSQTGITGPSIFPFTGLGSRLRIVPIQGLLLQAAVLDGVPGDPSHPEHTAIHLRRSDGALLTAEMAVEFGMRGPVSTSGGRLALGGYRYTRGFECLLKTAGIGADHECRSQGLYIVVESTVLPRDGSQGTRAEAFLRAGLSDSKANRFRSFVGSGVVFTGILPSRPEDRLGVAVASAINGGEFQVLQRSAVEGSDRAEIALELTYDVQTQTGLVFQPDVQYIVNPDTDPAIQNALVLGLRVDVSF